MICYMICLHDCACMIVFCVIVSLHIRVYLHGLWGHWLTFGIIFGYQSPCLVTSNTPPATLDASSSHAPSSDALAPSEAKWRDGSYHPTHPPDGKDVHPLHPLHPLRYTQFGLGTFVMFMLTSKTGYSVPTSQPTSPACYDSTCVN